MGDSGRIVPSSVFHSQRASSHPWCGEQEEENPWRDQVAPRTRCAGDDAHLRSLGIKPSSATLGFLSNFAIAFSFISGSTGSYGNFSIGSECRAGVFWSWPIVIVGQFIVALVFRRAGEPHFPWPLDLPVVQAAVDRHSLGHNVWFYLLGTGGDGPRWPFIVAFVIAGIVQQPGFLDRPIRRPDHDVHVHLARHAGDDDADQRIRRAPALAAQQPRRRNRDPRMGLRADPAVLREQTVTKHPVRLGGHRGRDRGAYLPALRSEVHGALRRLRLRHGRDFGEKTVDAGRQAPRGVLWSVRSPARRDVSWSRSSWPSRTCRPRLPKARPSVPDRDDDPGHADGGSDAGITLVRSTCSSSCASVFVCTLAIRRRDAMMFSMSRDRHPAARRHLGPGQPDVPDAGECRHRGRWCWLHPDPRHRSAGASPSRSRRPVDLLTTLLTTSACWLRGSAAGRTPHAWVQPSVAGAGYQRCRDRVWRADADEHLRSGRTRRSSATSAVTGERSRTRRSTGHHPLRDVIGACRPADLERLVVTAARHRGDLLRVSVRGRAADVEGDAATGEARSGSRHDRLNLRTHGRSGAPRRAIVAALLDSADGSPMTDDEPLRG